MKKKNILEASVHIPVKSNEAKYFHALSVLDKLFKENDIHYWLEAGSLIGAMREGTYLEWDKDMDTSFFEEDLNRVDKLKPEFEKHGLLLLGETSFRLCDKAGNHLICVMPCSTVDDYLVKYSYYLDYLVLNHVQRLLPELHTMISRVKLFMWFRKKCRKISFTRAPIDYLGNFAYVEWCGTMCSIPEHAESYLAFRFGNWREPVEYKCNMDVGWQYTRRTYP